MVLEDFREVWGSVSKRKLQKLELLHSLRISGAVSEGGYEGLKNEILRGSGYAYTNWTRFFNFRGRATRTEFWLLLLITLVALFVSALVSMDILYPIL